LSSAGTPLVAAIVDYGMGNLFSVESACMVAGMKPLITEQPSEIEAADLIILPGIGAFPDAMANLREKELDPVLRRIAEAGRPLVGICLGMQLLLSQSDEFEVSAGLGLIPGRVRDLTALNAASETEQKIPNIGWAPIDQNAADPLLDGLRIGEEMYFVHSLFVEPDDKGIAICTAEFAGLDFCAGFRVGNIAGLQFHPERSGPAGLAIYANIRDWAAERLAR